MCDVWYFEIKPSAPSFMHLSLAAKWHASLFAIAGALTVLLHDVYY